jgi:hypothetical protein
MMADLPEGIEEVRILRPQEGDIIVARFAEATTQDTRDEAIAGMESLFPWHKVAVLGPFDELYVVKPAQKNSGKHAGPGSTEADPGA